MAGTQAASGAQSAEKGEFWLNGARLAVSFSLMFEAGGQPINGAGGPVTEPIQSGAPDLPTNSFFEYGVTEGIPRLLDLFDRHEIKVSSFMIGEAVRKRPDLAAEIVHRGHKREHTDVHGPLLIFCPRKRKRLSSRTTYKPLNESPDFSQSAGMPIGCVTRQTRSRSCKISDSSITLTTQAQMSRSFYHCVGSRS
jgi:Polysaccharide deacetylase